MAAVSDTIPHIVRTAQVPRQEGLHHVQVSKIDQVNSSVRLIQLQLPSTDVGPEIVPAYDITCFSHHVWMTFLVHN